MISLTWYVAWNAISLVTLGSLPCDAWSTQLIADEPSVQLPWPQFRGPGGDGVAANCQNLPAAFGESKNVVWQVDVPGTGWSSPIADSKLLWMTSAVEQEVGQGVQLVLLAFERANGRQRHYIPLIELLDPELIHSLNSYASPTPCLDAQHVYCHFGTFGTAAVRRSDGHVVWKNEEIRLEHGTGPGSSPILFDDKVIFHTDGMDIQAIIALDCQSGQIRWRTPRSGQMSTSPDQRKAFCTPQTARIDDRWLLISPAADWLYVYNPEDGTELFRVPYGELGYSTVPRPILFKHYALICTGFDRSRLLSVDLRTGYLENDSNRIRWKVEQRVPTMPSPLLVDGLLYLVSDAGIASCLDAETGEMLWTERLGGKFAASPLVADGKIYFANQSGDVTVIRPGTEFTQVSVNKLDSAVMASPLAIGDRLYIRTAKRLYAFSEQ